MKRKHPKIYIAGPMRGFPNFNHPKFNDYAESHRAVGWYVENPVEIGNVYGTPEQINADPALLAEVMAAELHALKKCDAIYLLDGWQNSEGARKELATAIAYGLKIYLAPVVYIPLIRREP
jgi:hypothetical protein